MFAELKDPVLKEDDEAREDPALKEVDVEPRILALDDTDAEDPVLVLLDVPVLNAIKDPRVLVLVNPE